jgi:hypothetical protein
VASKENVVAQRLMWRGVGGVELLDSAAAGKKMVFRPVWLLCQQLGERRRLPKPANRSMAHGDRATTRRAPVISGFSILRNP